MKAGNLFLILFIPVAIFTTMLVIDWAGKTDAQNHHILAEKKLMQRADQIKRKGYEIAHHAGMVCGYYYWKDGMKWNIDQYCVGRFGKIQVLPDSLTFPHRRMIEEVDKFAKRKGYGGW